MVMGNMRKYFSGSIASEKLAGKVYDRFAIQNLGLKAKTNFEYSRKDLIRIVDEINDNLIENNTEEDSPETLYFSGNMASSDFESACKET